MTCFRNYIAYFVFLFLLFSTTAKAQSSRFDNMVMEKTMEFTLRDIWQKPDTLLTLIGIEPAEKVAEIGAGEGYFSVKLAEQVGPDGKLLALDIDPERLNVLRLLKRYGQFEQIEIVENKPKQLDLKAASLDKVVMVNTYHEIEDFEAILKQCFEALKPGGSIYIIDSYDTKLDNDKASRKKLFKKHSIRPVMVASDLEAAGFSVKNQLDKYTKQPEKIEWFYIAASKE